MATALVFDARLSAPSHAITLTTHVPWEELDPATYRRGSERLWARLRRHYGRRVQYAACVEFTTGRGAKSGGRRRMHAHHLVKGLDGADVLEVERLTRETWERTTGAYIVEVAELLSPGAAIAYLGLHHRKPAQAPPEGWRGMRFRASQGYWSRPVAQLREEARRAQLHKKLRWRLEQAGAPPDVADELAWLETAPGTEPGRLVRVRERDPLVPVD